MSITRLSLGQPIYQVDGSKIKLINCVDMIKLTWGLIPLDYTIELRFGTTDSLSDSQYLITRNCNLNDYDCVKLNANTEYWFWLIPINPSGNKGVPFKIVDKTLVA